MSKYNRNNGKSWTKQEIRQVNQPYYNHEVYSLVFKHNDKECRVSLEALDCFGATNASKIDYLQTFSNNKREIMDVVNNKFLLNPNEEIIIVTSEDFLKREGKLPIKIRDK